MTEKEKHLFIYVRKSAVDGVINVFTAMTTLWELVVWRRTGEVNKRRNSYWITSGSRMHQTNSWKFIP